MIGFIVALFFCFVVFLFAGNSVPTIGGKLKRKALISLLVLLVFRLDYLIGYFYHQGLCLRDYRFTMNDRVDWPEVLMMGRNLSDREIKHKYSLGYRYMSSPDADGVVKTVENGEVIVVDDYDGKFSNLEILQTFRSFNIAKGELKLVGSDGETVFTDTNYGWRGGWFETEVLAQLFYLISERCDGVYKFKMNKKYFLENR